MQSSCRFGSRMIFASRTSPALAAVAGTGKFFSARKVACIISDGACQTYHRPLVRKFHFSSTLQQGLGEPPAPEIPLYDALNVQIKGYDFAILEKFARYVHKTADRVGLDVEDCWATPAQNLKVTQLKPESTVVETEYTLNLYERNVQITDVPATLLPVFVNIVEASIPAGVTLRIHPHLPEHTELRYVPDLELKKLKQELQDMHERKEEARKK